MTKPTPIPEPPGHLSTESKAFWRSVLAEYELAPAHLKLLRLACEQLDRAEAARKLILSGGLTIQERGREVANPAVMIERNATITFNRTMRELGLDLAPPTDFRPPRRGGGR